ncbi:MAG: hypothetical protein DHS20C11_37570 [Lysobacteraceae bacterium]|nr:MAG: hypothetical protein DHS20C11_37570 [Xanthomonadaceae bacterium]
MHTLIEICIDRTHGALLRALGLIERRGHQIMAVHALGVNASQQHYLIAVDSDGRDPEVLVRQLSRNVDLQTARLLTAQTNAALGVTPWVQEVQT